jgi:hypothetical protein
MAAFGHSGFVPYRACEFQMSAQAIHNPVRQRGPNRLAGMKLRN